MEYPKTALFGLWDPVKEEGKPVNNRSWMEWWPSQRAAERSMRERIYPGGAVTIISAARHTSRPDREDAQFYGSIASSCIYLYDTPDAPEPHAVMEFGPRGGIRVRALVGEKVEAAG